MSRYVGISVGAGLLVGAFTGYLFWTTRSLDAPDRALSLQPSESTPAADASSSAFEDLEARPSPSAWLASALEQVDTLGYTAEAIERVASELPYIRAQGLRVIATEGLAERNVSAAIAYALTLSPPTIQSAALKRVAEVAAHSSPQVALSRASLIPSGLQRAAYTEQVIDTWASLDPEGVLDRIEHATVSLAAVSPEALATLAPDEPARVLALLYRLPDDVRQIFQKSVIDALLTADPDSVYAYVDARPMDSPMDIVERGRLLSLIVSSDKQLSPSEALSRILSVRAPMSLSVAAALGKIPEEDFPSAFQQAMERSIEIVASGEEPVGTSGRLADLVSAALQHGAPNISAVVDLIANHPDPRVRGQLNGGVGADWSVLARWAARDPEGAVAWTIRNPSRVSAAVVERLGQLSAAASGDPAAMKQDLYDLPEDVRGYWMAGVAEGLASSSLDAAVEWLEPARGAPVYSTVINDVLRNAASTEPATVARVIDNMPDTPEYRLVINVAVKWGAKEPGRAGDWLAANRNIDDEVRTQAIRQMVIRWADRDLQEARLWTQRQSVGPLRDAALGAVMESALAAGSIDPEVLAAFSSDRARSLALIGVMDTLRRSDPDLGQSLIDKYVSDPELRDTAEQRLTEGVATPFPNDIDGIQIR